MNISDKIKEIRQKKGIKQVDIANMLNTERTNYGRLEQRGEKLTIEQLFLIAKSLNVSVSEILEIEPNKPNLDIIESQSKRIKELESWLKDKDKIIELLSNK